MNALRKTWGTVQNLFTIYIPVLAFVSMFCIFIIQIFARYVLRNPPAWALELSFATYVYLVMTGACYATRKRKHVEFSLVYDLFSLRARAFLSFIGNLIIFVAFSASAPLSVKYVFSMSRQVTGALKIGMHFVYAPYLIFLFFTLIYMLRDMFHDVMIFSGRATRSLEKKFEQEQMKDYEIAIREALRSEDQE